MNSVRLETCEGEKDWERERENKREGGRERIQQKRASATCKRKERRKTRVNRITIIGSKSKSQLWLPSPSAAALFSTLLPLLWSRVSIIYIHDIYI